MEYVSKLQGTWCYGKKKIDKGDGIQGTLSVEVLVTESAERPNCSLEI